MSSKISHVIKNAFIMFSVIFSITTITSSSWQLYIGQATDTNVHILNRAAVVAIAVITIFLFDKVKLKSKFLSYLVPYVVSVGIVLGYTWLFGQFSPLHPDAYRDIFLNFTAIAIGVIFVLMIKDKIKNRKE